jgi:hypothetical protein
MQRFTNWLCRLIVLAFVVIGLPRIAWCMWHDAQHRELWADPNHNFPLEIALLVFLLVASVWLAIEIFRRQQLIRERHVFEQSRNGVPRG